MKRHAPATARNREPILEAIADVLRGAVLEVASGSGEHAAFLAPRLPVTWQPTDLDAKALDSIDAWCTDLANVLPARILDASVWPWPVTEADSIFCANMIHIAPPAAGDGLLVGASRLLPAGGPLVVYGPFREAGAHTSESNARFDEDLQRRHPSWGVRDLDSVLARAAELGLRHDRTVSMPANNRVVILRATEAASKRSAT